MKLRRLGRGLVGRAYEGLLAMGLVSYRRPFQYYDVEVWNSGYRVAEHDHYENIADAARYGALLSYLCFLEGELRILDIGCGTGTLRTRLPAEKVGSYLGVDTSSEAIKAAQRRAVERSVFQVSEIPSDGVFDVIICNEVLYLIDDIPAFLSKVRPLMAPDGVLLMSNTRFHGDFFMRRLVSKEFIAVDESTVVNVPTGNKWRVACYKVRQQGALKRLLLQGQRFGPVGLVIASAATGYSVAQGAAAF